jgi:hypothetical protein
VIGSADVLCAGVAILAAIICQAAAGSRVVVAEFAGTTLNGADIDNTVFPFAGWRNRREVHLAGRSGHCIEAIRTVKVLFTTTAGNGHPFTLTVGAIIDSAGVAVVTDELSCIGSAAFCSNGCMSTCPVDAFVNCTSDAIVTFQRAFAASFSG